MKSLKISIVAAIFFSIGMSSIAQNQDNSTVVFSQRGVKKATPVKIYVDTNYKDKSKESVLLDLKGEMGLPEMDKDSIVGVYDSTNLDYEYAARIKRFHGDMSRDYFDDYYTNTYYYTHNPYDWGRSIYTGWGWHSYLYWNSFFDPYLGWGNSFWTYPYYFGYGYPYWGSYCYWGFDYYWGYNDYYWGYNDYYHPHGGQHHHNSPETNSHRPNQQLGHALMGGPQDPHNPNRRGGVDVNNGRTSTGNSRLTNSSSSRTVASNEVSGSRFSKPESVSNARTAASNPNRGTSDRYNYASNGSSSSSRTSMNNNGYNNSNRFSSSSYSTGSSNTYRAGSSSSYSSSRSTSSFSSGSSMSGSRSSSSFSSGSSMSGSRGSSSFSGGSSHSSSSHSSSSHSSSSSSRH